ncbi:MAG: hypothetical protein OHK0046_16310 [Anaerolineae bacterium]
MRILYVEDNQANASLVQRIAKAGNHEFINYVDAETALAEFDSLNPDIVIVDLRLAGQMDGLELVQHLRNGGYDLPVVVMTAYATDGERDYFLAAGCDEFLVKPASVNQIVALLDAIA